ncbi:MAG: NAD(P)/FAD-dependent oxidoreductase, partial [Thermoplasmata archaeon]|nr:NAD(P)/FAD-dependent oxidoreductase [Thermoplasmata archaeon]
TDMYQRKISEISIFTPKGREYEVTFDGFTVNRDDLDKHLASLAEKEGARIVTGTIVRRVSGTEVVTDKGTHSAKVIVGADGPSSAVARSVGLEAPRELCPAITCQVDGDFEPRLKMYFGKIAPGGYAWIVPKKDCANVGLGISKKFGTKKVKILFNQFLAENGFTPRSTAGGIIPMSGPIPRTVTDNVIAVGDAAGHVMTTNGGGVNAAMTCGRIAGECVADHILKEIPLINYELRWREVIGNPLATAVSTKRLADLFFGSDLRLEFAMRILGAVGATRAIRCQGVFRGKHRFPTRKD